MRRSFCSSIAALAVLLGHAQEQPRRGTYSDGPYMRQFEVTRTLVEILADGRKAGLSSFFERSSYCDSIQPTLDSLAAVWGARERKLIIVGGEIVGPTNRMRATVLTSDHKVLGQVMLHYDPKDLASLVRRFEVVPMLSIVFDESDLPPEEPPPTQRELFQARPK